MIDAIGRSLIVFMLRGGISDEAICERLKCTMQDVAYEKMHYNPDWAQNTGNMLCWNCKNACGGCEWSKSFEPVDGWVARKIPTEGRYGFITELKNPSLTKPSYHIFDCPKFGRDRE